MTIALAALREAITLGCESTQPAEARAEALILVVRAGAPVLPAALAPFYEQARALSDGEHLAIPMPNGNGVAADVVEIIALTEFSQLPLRRAARRVGGEHRGRLEFALAGLPADGSDQAVLSFVRGFAEGRYRYARYRADAAVLPARLSVVGVPEGELEPLARELADAEIVESAVRWARDLTNTPARDLTPVALAEEAAREAERCGASVRILDETWLEREGFAGLVSVGAGSPNPPRLVEIAYRGSDAPEQPSLVLVGKGITFDSGGLSLKKASAMIEMKSDMAGAATALAAVCALARLGDPGIHVVALLALAENMPGPGALRPGDIIRHRNDLTTEVVNTDCEGRLVMSDVLSWAAERSPDAIIDIATLTYSTISALGMQITSVIGNDAALISSIRAAGERTGDPYWELPLWEPYRSLIESPFADLRNEESEDGPGAIAAALFLRAFVAGTPWAHLDTGGTAYLDEAADGLEAGATGSCIRSLVRLASTRQSPTQQGAES